MLVSFKDSLKLIGISVISFCAVFVCTFFLNFYLDAKSLDGTLTDPNLIALYDAQMATAKFVCAVSGGFLGLIAFIMLVFYIKLYIDKNACNIGILKAMGYSERNIALKFSMFGLSVLPGTVLGFGCGFAIMPTVYDGLTIDGLPEIAISFYPSLLFLLVFLPPVVFSILSSLYAYIALRRPVSELMKGKSEKIKRIKPRKEKERSFLKEMFFKTLCDKKALAFFVAFACFCFSTMVQMGASMYDMSTALMGVIIFAIGVVLAVTTILMAATTLVNGNIKNVSIMKAFGYSMKECALTVLGGYHIFAVIGFAVGSVYQYGLLTLMVNLIFKDVAGVPEYSFDVPIFFATLAAFIVFYEAVMLFFAYRIKTISVKEVMAET